MLREKIECEIITPTLMHGANSKIAELRPPSIKGAIRFWWRAIHGNLDLNQLKEQEFKIFGGADENNAIKSRFNIFIDKELNINYKNNKELYNSFSKYPGVKYNFYSLIISQNKKGNSIYNGKFILRLNFLNEETKTEVFKTLNYLNFFGNLGARSRRGAGSVKFIHNELLKFSGDTKEELKEFINNHFEKNINENYSTFAKSIYLFNPKNNWEKALESIAKKFKDFRYSNKSRVFETPNFGFPIRHKDKSIFLGGKKVNNQEKCIIVERRASPLIFKIYKSDNNKFFPMIIWLNGKLLDDDYKIIKKYDCNQLESPNEKIIKEFLSTFKGNEYVKC